MSNFEKVNELAELPVRGTKNSAGYDLCAVGGYIIPAHGRCLVKTGLTCSMKNNEYLAIVPRSGLALKQGITVLNTPGTIDSDYYPNEIGVILYNTTDNDFDVEPGDRIAQAILKEYKIMENDLVKNKERTSGFGSTGIK